MKTITITTEELMITSDWSDLENDACVARNPQSFEPRLPSESHVARTATQFQVSVQ